MTSPRSALPVARMPDVTGIVSWVHFGDLHMTTRAEGNYRDFRSLIEEVNDVMADSVSFAYLPGDNADHGDEEGTATHCASSFRPARMSAAVSAAGPS